MDAVLLRHLLSIGRRMAETSMLDPLLEYAVDISLQVLNAQYGYLVLVNNDGTLDFRVRRDRNGNNIAEAARQISYTIFTRVIESGEPVKTASALDDPELSDSSSVYKLQLRSVLCVPLISHGKILGALYVENRERQDLFTDDDLEPLLYLASQAAICIDNNFLNEELEEIVAKSDLSTKIADLHLEDKLNTQERRVIDSVLENERMNIMHSFIQDTLHQFRTPLAVINTSADILARKINLPENGLYLDHIHEQVATITSLVDSLVMMAKLDQSFVVEDSPVYLQELVYNLYSGFQETAAQKNQQFELYQAEQPIYLRGMVEYIRQAVSAVILNALQYTPNNGRIAIYVEETDAVTIAVEDNGIGIAGEEIPHLFTRFYRSDKVGTTRGLGLGLSIAQKIMELHHGVIQVESEIGRGSIFRLFFPKIEGEL